MGTQRGAMEDLAMIRRSRVADPGFWYGKQVFLTGHTGFKGAWLSVWLGEMGANVHGFSLEPPTSPNLFDLCDLAGSLASDTRADLRDAAAVSRSMNENKSEVVLHLAAQSLVRPSYTEPLATFATNVMGTAHVLDAACQCPSVKALVVVTTDKCYENREWVYPYRETDRLGGKDPYSASKAAAELVTSSWRSSFAGAGTGGIRIASARAGNVIGAGDWALDRLLPDCFQAFARGDSVTLRNPGSVRPWQHVLDPLNGYLVLAEALYGNNGLDFAGAWNFGPDPNGEATVEDVASLAASLWGGSARVQVQESGPSPHEAGLLRLDSSLARARLAWQPRWELKRALEATVTGYRLHAAGGDLGPLVRNQISEFVNQDGAVGT